MKQFKIERAVNLLNSESILLNRAKELFLRRKFEEAIKVLEEALLVDDGRYQQAINTNLACLYHVTGDFVKAEQGYEQIDRTIMREINYEAFCHKYFMYSHVSTNDIKDSIPLYPLYKHNRINYLMSTQGYEGMNAYQIENIYDEQLVNDVRVRMGTKIDTRFNDELKSELQGKSICQEYHFVQNKRIGIFVTDVQRHKDAAIIYELVDVLSKDYEVYIYFNNIFKNKLIKQFEERAIVRHVINCSFYELIEIIRQDEINALVDLAEYGLRNCNLAISYLADYVIPISQVLKETPLVLQSQYYYPQVMEKEDSGVLLIIGDLKCITEKELLYIKRYERDYHLVFESHAFDEEMYQELFEKKLIQLGYDRKHTEVIKGILPFQKYCNFLSSAKAVLIANGASHVEVSEAMACNVPILVLSENPVIRKMSTIYQLDQADDTNSIVHCPEKKYSDSLIEQGRKAFVSNLLQSIEKTEKHGFYCKEHDFVISYEEGRSYCFNNTCNGDIIVFDDIEEKDRNEYFINQ